MYATRPHNSYRLNMKLKYITLLFSAALLMLGVACGGAAEPEEYDDDGNILPD